MRKLYLLTAVIAAAGALAACESSSSASRTGSGGGMSSGTGTTMTTPPSTGGTMGIPAALIPSTNGGRLFFEGRLFRLRKRKAATSPPRLS
jgi:hypothetical protein